MTKPTLVQFSRTLVKEKAGKTVWEYNHGEFEKIDVARTKMVPNKRYPDRGWVANGEVTMMFCCTGGEAKIQLESGEVFSLKTNDVFLVPPKCWYFLISGKKGFEAWMPSSPAWFSDQALHKT